MATPILMRAYPAGHFLLTLDGMPEFGFIKAVEGGGVSGQVLSEGVGPDNEKFRHLGPVQTGEITLQVGLGMGKMLFDWLKSSFSKNFRRMSGSIIHANFDYRGQHEQAFQRALITECTFPVLDGSEKNAGYLTLKILPEEVKLKRTAGTRLLGQFPSKRQKLWLPCNFRLVIDGINTKGVNRIESFSIKQKVQRLYTGERRIPEIEPTSLEVPNLVVTTSLARADDFIKWHDKFVVQGDKDPAQEKEGAIEFLSPNLKDVLMTVKLQRLGIFNLTINKHDAAQPNIHRCKVEMYCEKMDLIAGKGL